MVFGILESNNSKKYWVILLPVLVLTLGSILHYSRGYYGIGNSALFAYGVDDAYITYRYGWNLANFGILSWNESGYRLAEGFTNPLWMLVSAVWSLLGIKTLVYPLSVITSVVVSGFFLLILSISVYNRQGKSLSAIIGLIMVCAIPPIWLHMTAGLESGVFGIGLALLAYLVIFDNPLQSKPILILLLSLIIGLLRSDGFVYLAIILIAAVISGSKAWKPVAVGLLAGSIALFSWRFLQFGTLLPNTAVAKINFSLLERLPLGAKFLFATLTISGLVIFLILGVAGIWLENRRKKLAGIFIIIAWIAYYIYIGGDGYVERHLIGIYFLAAAFSAPLWRVAKPLTRGIFILAILLVVFISITQYGSRFSYLSTKSNDPWVMLGQAIEADRDRYGVVITFAAGKIPFYGGGDFIDSIGLNDPYLATLKREGFVPGHSAGDENAAIEMALNHPAGIYSMFSYLNEGLIKEPDRINLWVDNFHPQDTAQSDITTEDWESAIASDNEFVWSIISNPK
ncbi:MAG: hypothetical protein ACXADH_06370 [Candidatus Kariarchaeaceae archaeon]